MRSFLMTSAAVVAALAIAAPVMAQSASAPEPSAKPGAADTLERSATPATEGGSQAAAIPPEDLKGMPVHDASGEKIGEVEDVRTGAGGDVERLIVSQGGFMGLGAKKIAIDGQQARIQSDRVTLGLTGSQVSELPDYQDPGAAAETPPAASPAEPSGADQSGQVGSAPGPSGSTLQATPGVMSAPATPRPAD